MIVDAMTVDMIAVTMTAAIMIAVTMTVVTTIVIMVTIVVIAITIVVVEENVTYSAVELELFPLAMVVVVEISTAAIYTFKTEPLSFMTMQQFMALVTG